MRAGDRRSSGWRLGAETPGGAGADRTATGADARGEHGGAVRRAARLLAGFLTACAVVALYLMVLSRGDLR
ncbi:hypothetical protein [Streptomyces sp. NBC_00102]|uniref:hypothetical protein n=1 Tax=Streptomyces sp. NBC_00102 TaxID=2975652 RepID=UPI002253C7D4|nr:hypothetical protein [Streptomyces sp. NBC_00102]MCX5399840.1 hypothetical protein [Streptomyces sp. NBC_00102]